MPELMVPPMDKKVLSKPRPLSSHTLRDQSSLNISRSSSCSTNSEKGIPEEPVQEGPPVQKSIILEKRQNQHQSNKDVGNNIPPTQKISPKPEELKKKEKPDEYFEIIESSVKCFQTKIGKELSKDSLLTDTKSNSSIGDDVVLNNKENKNTLNYRTQYKSVTPARELPTIINSDQTYKLRDQYSLRRASEDSQGEEPFYRKDLVAEKKMIVNQAWQQPTRHMPKDQLVPESRPWDTMEPSQKRMLFSERPHVRSTENTQQFMTKNKLGNERERFAADGRYEAETRRILAEIQRHQYERPLYEEPFNQRRIVPDFLPDNIEIPRRENQGNHLGRRISEQGKRRNEAEETQETRTDVGEMPRPVLKKYMSEKSLPKSKGLRESTPAQPMHWSTVSLPDVQNVQESHKSNLYKWKETNLDTSSDSSDTIDAVGRPREEYNDNDKGRGYLTGPYVMSYPVDDEDPKYFVKSVMDQARTVRYNDTSDERSGWIETDLDAPPSGQYTQDDHVYDSDNSGWWVETDLDSMEESLRDNTFNKGFVSDSGRPDKYCKSLGTEKYPPYYHDEYSGFEGSDYDRDHRYYGVDGISSRKSHLYENLDTHVRYPGERDRYLDLSQELHPKHDEDPNPERERMRSTKRVHYKDQMAPHSQSSRFDDDDDEISRSLRSKFRGDQQRDAMPVTNQKYNTMPDMKKHKKDSKKKDQQHRHSDHGEGTNSYLYRDPYLRYDREGSGIQTERDPNGFNPGQHERSFEISPDMYYSHSFGSSETNWRPYPEVSHGYHSQRDQDEPYPQVHVGDPEYWERIPIEGQHSPSYHRNPEEYPPRNYDQYPVVDPFPVPGWNPDPHPVHPLPVPEEAGHRDAAERVSSHNNSDLGFHELSFASMASSEHLQDKLHHPEDSAGIEGLRFKQLEVHRTTAAALSAYNNTSPEHSGRDRHQIKSPRPVDERREPPRRRSREDNTIYENLKPIDNYWSDHNMDRARKGELDVSTQERAMNVYGHEQGFATGSEFGHYNQHRQKDTSERIYTRPPEVANDLHRAPSNQSKKERSMSYRYRPHSEHLEQHRDMIQEYLDEINKNVPSLESKQKSKKHKRHSQSSMESPRKHEQYYPGYGEVHTQHDVIKPPSSHKKHKHSDKNSPRKNLGYAGSDVHQAHTLPRSLKFGEDRIRPEYQMYQPHMVKADNKGFVVTGNPKKSKNIDKDINAYFLSQV